MLEDIEGSKQNVNLIFENWVNFLVDAETYSENELGSFMSKFFMKWL